MGIDENRFFGIQMGFTKVVVSEVLISDSMNINIPFLSS